MGAEQVLKILHEEYGNPRTALNYSNPLELLVATILSARNTDKQVNKVTKDLFKKYRRAEDYANIDLDELKEDISSIGLYNQKAEWIQKTCRIIVEKHGGEVPDTMEELTKLPGVARKTANVVLGNVFGKAVGVVVDTHVKRVGERLDLHSGGTAVNIEEQLMRTIPREEWIFISHALIEHGRAVCTARKPKCPKCPLKNLCPSHDKFMEEFW